MCVREFTELSEDCKFAIIVRRECAGELSTEYNIALILSVLFTKCVRVLYRGIKTGGEAS